MERRQFLTLVAGATGLAARPRAPWKAGVAIADITPLVGIWMAGFADRKCPSEGVALPLHAKVLALEDERSTRAVLVTVDLLGVTAALRSRIVEAVGKRHRLPPDALLLNASHTHSGPVIDGLLSIAYDLTPAQTGLIHEYTQGLERRLVELIGDALGRLQPARLSAGEARAEFAANRRAQFFPAGPVDHSVPVLRVDRLDGRPLAIVFGYACHNTTLQGGSCQLHGDYAGVAQAALERRHPDAAALFVAGCGGDINPKPRGTMELVERHGADLADAVERALPSLAPVSGPLRTAYDVVGLPFAPPPGRGEWDARRQDEDPFVRRHAQMMLEALDRDGRLPAVQPAPVQVWRFGRDLTLVALGGEVVVDYALRLKRDHSGDRLWIAAYSNDVFGYVPSRRVLEEGGYEGGGAMMYYGKPGPFAPDAEELIHGKVRELMGGPS
jgi:hypothetical protein